MRFPFIIINKESRIVAALIAVFTMVIVRHLLMFYFLRAYQDASLTLKVVNWITLFIILFLAIFIIDYVLKTQRQRRASSQQLERQAEELRQNLTFIKDLYDNAPVGYHSVDKDGVFLEINQTELDWLGYSKEEVIGKMKIFDFMPPEQLMIHKERFQTLKKTGRFDNMEGMFQRKDGSLMPILASSVATFDKNGNYLYNRSTTFDFTEGKKLEETLKSAVEAAEQASLLKEQFVANMSHEIRTPLNAIIGFSRLLQRTDLRDDQQEFVSNIHISSENLLAVVNEILDFSKIQAGAVRIERMPFSLLELVHSVEAMFRFRSEEQNLSFEVRIEAGLPEILFGDPNSLRQILINLLGNAFKFTEKGSVCLSVSQAVKSGDKTILRFSVEDTGIGIPADLLGVIFERFIQASAQPSRQSGGTGLGLTICKKLAEAQGGAIRVDSEQGKGALFIVEIPYDLDGEQLSNHEKEQPGKFHNGKLHILVVEDNAMNRRFAELLLTGWGFHCEHAENGKIALDLLRRRSYDLVLMDIQMPEMDGYTAVRLIRQDLRLEVPIIATTAHAFAGEHKKCLAFGMNDYVSKPLNETELYAAIERHAKLGKKRSQVEAPVGTPDTKDFDRQAALGFSRGNLEVLREMATMFSAQSQLELGQMDAALGEGNFTQAAAAAHSMTSTAAYLGFAGSLGEMLRRFETEAYKDTPDHSMLKKMMMDLHRQRMWAVGVVEREFLG